MNRNSDGTFGPKWTKEQLELLKENYGRLTLEDLGAKLDRSTASIYHMASRKGILTTPKDTMNSSRIERCSDVDLSWLAAIIEGEGSLHIQGYSKGSHIGHIPYIEISNTEIEILQSCQDLLGGIIRVSGRSSLTRKEQYRLDFHGCGPVKTALESLRPFMRGSKRKRAIAKLMIEFCEIQQTHYWKQKQNYNPQIRVREQEIYFQVRALNRKGPQP